MYQLSVTSKQLLMVVLLSLFCICGCGGFRFTATEAQKENAWLHQRVCAAAAETAQDESTSAQLCELTQVAHQQSEAFVLDYGLPENPLPPSGYSPLAGGELEGVLAQAKIDAAKRPDVWTVADSVMELGLALAGLVGGIYGVRAAGFLKAAREKSTALKEIIQGNELFKQLYPEQAERFKDAQAKQSPTTKQLVTAEKAQ